VPEQNFVSELQKTVKHTGVNIQEYYCPNSLFQGARLGSCLPEPDSNSAMLQRIVLTTLQFKMLQSNPKRMLCSFDANGFFLYVQSTGPKNTRAL
jgi:hypothetical protein